MFSFVLAVALAATAQQRSVQQIHPFEKWPASAVIATGTDAIVRDEERTPSIVVTSFAAIDDAAREYDNHASAMTRGLIEASGRFIVFWSVIERH